MFINLFLSLCLHFSLSFISLSSSKIENQLEDIFMIFFSQYVSSPHHLQALLKKIIHRRSYLIEAMKF
jgi:hypothetical protein